MPNDSHRPDVAVFIDFENVYVSVRDKLDANPNFEMIMDRCEDFGRVVIARAYADWYRYPRVTSALYANSIEPMYVPTYYYDRELGRTGRAIKNSVDMNLCIDAMKTLFTNPNIAKFVLATGDRDFIPLVNSIRQQGKEVIVIGIGGAASAHLAQSADEFIFYESLVGKKPAELQSDLPRAKMPEKGREYADNEAEPAPVERPREREPREPREREPAREPEPARVEVSSQPDIYDTLVSAIQLARERGYVCSFGSLKLLMKELMGGDFKEGKYKDSSGRPFAKFKDFVLEAERRAKVQVFTRGTVNEVFLPGEDPYKLSQFAQEIKEEPSSPVVQMPELEIRADSRVAAAPNGRRRRRRSRGGQRPGTGSQNGAGLLDAGLEEELEGEELEEADLPELILPEPAEPVQAAEDVDTSSAALFEELLERVEEEQAEFPAIVDEPAVPTPEPQAPEPRVLESEPQAQAPLSQPFTDEEWRLLREVVGRFERPVSFVQIHDAMRNARNSAGITRTNEELRSLIKQAINSNLLERIGKGTRASYRVAPSDGDLAAAPAGAPDQAEQIAPSVEEPPAQADMAEGAPPEFHTPEAAAQAELASVAASDDPPEITVETARPESRRVRSRRKPAAEPVAEPPVAPAQAAAAEPAKPKRSSRKPAAPAAEAAPEPAAETPAKPKRSRRKKTEAAE